MVPDAALGRAPAQVVLDPVAGEHLDVPVVHLDREVDGQLAPRLAEYPAQAGVEVKPVGGQVELLLRHLPRVDLGSGVLGGHEEVVLRLGRSPPAALRIAGRLPDDPTARCAAGARRARRVDKSGGEYSGWSLAEDRYLLPIATRAQPPRNVASGARARKLASMHPVTVSPFDGPHRDGSRLRPQPGHSRRQGDRRRPR